MDLRIWMIMNDDDIRQLAMRYVHKLSNANGMTKLMQLNFRLQCPIIPRNLAASSDFYARHLHSIT